MFRIILLPLAALTLVWSACDKGATQTEPAAPQKVVAANTNNPAPADKPAADKPAADKPTTAAKPGADPKEEADCDGPAHKKDPASKGEHDDGHDCGHSEPVKGEAVAVKTPDGKTMMHGGPDFTDAAVVAVADIVDRPTEFAGKRVKVKGDISAMCHHRRGWFAVTAGDKSGKQMRVITVPAFKVPAESIGKSAVAEGVIEVIDVPRQQAAHYAKDHGLPKPGADAGPIKRVVMKAVAADFID